jgi:hypothetical protein
LLELIPTSQITATRTPILENRTLGSPTTLQSFTLLAPSAQLSKPTDGFRGRMPSFLDRLFGFLNFIHAAEHERRQIALRNLFFARLFRAEPLPYKLSLSLLRGLLILRGDNWLVE